MYYNEVLKTHLVSVIIFVLIYFVKTLLLLMNKTEALGKVTKTVKVPEMIVSALFLVTGVYLWIYTGNGGAWILVKVIIVLASIPLAIIGFKRSNKMLAVLSFILILVAYRLGETKSLSFKKTVRPASEISAADMEGENAGKNIYAQYCVSCHGVEGNMMLSGAKDLTKSEMTLEERIDLIKKGKGTMVSYSNVLTESQIQAVAEYTTTLRK